jgi:hypothetical protein
VCNISYYSKVQCWSISDTATEKKSSSHNLESWEMQLKVTFSKGHKNMTFHNRKALINSECMDAICPTFDSNNWQAFLFLWWCLKFISVNARVSHDMACPSVGCWLLAFCVETVQYCITHDAQNTQPLPETKSSS